MGKSQKLNESLTSPSQHGEKKKKKKKNKEASEETEMTQDEVMRQLGFELADEKKKKKKKKKKNKQEEEDKEEEEGGEEKMDASKEESSKKKKKKQRNEEIVTKAKQVAFSPIVKELSSPKRNGKRLIEDSAIHSPHKSKKQRVGDIDRDNIDSYVTPITSKTVCLTSTPINNQNSPGTNKKKKKKNKDAQDLVDTEEDVKDGKTVSLTSTPMNNQNSPGKNKKKKKKNKDAQDSVDTEEDVKDGKGVGSPQKTQQEANTGLVKEDEEVEDEYLEGWPKKQQLELIAAVNKQLPSNDKRGYRAALNKVDWGSLGLEAHSQEDCKKELSQIFSKLQVYKTLGTLLEEARERIENDKLGSRPATAFTRFIRDFSKNRVDELKKPGVNNFSVMAAAWRKLPEEEKEKYKSSYLKDVEASKYRNEAVIKGVKPYQLWGKDEQRLKGNVKLQGLRQTFQELPDGTKLRYIKESLVQMLALRKKEEEEQGEEGKEGESKKPKKIVDGPTKEELQLYLSYVHMPEFPPARVAHFYIRTLQETGKLERSLKLSDKEMYAMYQKLTQDQKTKYRTLHQKRLDEIVGELQKWEEQQSEETRLAKELFMGDKLPAYLIPKPASTKKGRKKLSLTDLFPNTCPSVLACPKFPDEPKKPPVSAMRHYIRENVAALNHKKFKNNIQRMNACQSQWKSLPEEEKAKYVEEFKNLLEKYREELLEYVAGMDKRIRSLYLGFQRKPIYHIFKKDIFEQYPNSKYPVFFISSPKRSKEPTSKPVKEEEEEEDEEEDEEEEGKSSEKKSSVSDHKKMSQIYTSNSSEDEAEEVLDKKPLKTPKRALGRTPMPEKHLTDSFVRNNSGFQKSSDEEEEEEEEEDRGKTELTQAPSRNSSKNLQTKHGKESASVRSPPKKLQESSSEESSEDEGVWFDRFKKVGGKTGFDLKGRGMQKKEEKEEDSSADEENGKQQKSPPKNGAKMPSKPPAAPVKKEGWSEESSDDDEDDGVLLPWQSGSFVASAQMETSSSDESD